MRTCHLLLLLACVAFLAACGNDQRPGPPWLPSFNTPEEAMEAFARGIESGNIELIRAAVAVDERDAQTRVLEGIARSTEMPGASWVIEYDNPTRSENEAIATIHYIRKNADGETVATQTDLIVFVKQPDDSWRFSPRRLEEIKRQLQPRTEPQEPPHGQPEEPETPETDPSED